MEHKLNCQKIDFEEQFPFPWEWTLTHYRHLDGWELNKNRFFKDKYLVEMAKEFGPITIPHRKR